MRVGRIPYINCYPVYGAIDRGIVPMSAELVDGVPTVLNQSMKLGTLDVSVISAVEYARDSTKYLLLPDLSICSDGPVRSVVLFSKRPASELQGRRVLVSRSSMTSVALLELLFENVWDAKPATGGIWEIIKLRFLSMAMVLGTGCNWLNNADRPYVRVASPCCDDSKRSSHAGRPIERMSI